MATQMESNKLMVSKDFKRQLAGLRADHGANPLPAARSSVAAADLCLAGLRSLPEISRAQRFLNVLAREPSKGPLHSVTVAHSRLIKPAEIRAVNGEFRLH